MTERTRLLMLNEGTGDENQQLSKKNSTVRHTYNPPFHLISVCLHKHYN